MENGVNLLTLFAKIGLDSSEFHSGLKTASSTFQSFGDRMGAVMSTVGNAVTTGLTLASGAAVAFGTDSVNVGKTFDAAMANVASISGATGAAFDKLREKAIEMGGSTKFSATEAADAMGFMAMAGWKTEDMLDGVSGIMNLAAASGTDLATTADIVTDALTAFGLSASDSGHFADVLAVASSNANTNVQMMGETFKYVAPLAGALKLTAEDVAEAVGLMANAGIKGSQAGTALRAGLTRLVKPTGDMIPLMKQLGLAVSELSEEEAQAQIDALEKSLETRKTTYSEAEEALETSLQKQYDALKNSLDKSYDEKEKWWDKEIAAVERTQEKVLDDTQKAQEAAVKAYEKATEAKLELIDKEYQESLKLTNKEEYDRLKALDDQIAAIQEESEAAAKAAEEEERRQRRAELQKAINTADSAEKRREAEQKLADYNEKIRRQDEEAGRKARIAELKAQKDDVKEKAKAERDAAKAKRDADTKAYKEERAEGLEALKAKHKDELTELKRSQKELLDEKKASRKKDLDELKDANSRSLAELKKSNSKQLDALKNSNKEKLSEYQDYVKAQKKVLEAAEKSAKSIVLTDENGNMRTLNESVNLLREAFSGLSSAEQAEAASLLFGQEAMSGWLAMLNAAPGDIAKIEKSLATCSDEIDGYNGAAERMAAIHENSLAGGVTTLNSALETLKIRLSDQITPALRDFTGFAQNSVVALTNAFDTGGLSGMMDALSPVISGGIGKILEYLPDVLNIGGQILGAIVSGLMDNLPKLAEGAARVASQLGGYLLNAAPEIASKGGELLDFFASGIIENIDTLADTAINVIDTFAGFLADAIPSVAEKLTDVVVAIAETLSDPNGLENLATSAKTILDALADAVITNLPRLAKAALDIVTNLGNFIIEHLPDLFDVAKNIVISLGELLIENAPELLQSAVQIASDFAGYLYQAFRDILDNFGLLEGFDAVLGGVSAIFERVSETAARVFPEVRDAVLDAFSRIQEAAAPAVEFISGIISELVSGIGDYVSGGQAAEDITNVLSSSIEILGGAIEIAADFIATVAEKIADFITWLSEGSTGADLFTAAVTGIVSAFVAFQAALAINTLIGQFQKAIEGAQLAFKGFNAIMAANPLILVTTLIAGVVAALIVLWNTNEGFREAVKGIWKAIAGFFSDAWDAITKIWDGVADYFGRVWEDIQTIFSVVEPVLELLFSAAWFAVKKVWDVAVTFFALVWDGIKLVFSVVGDVIGGFFSVAWDAIVLVWDAATGYFENIWNTIAGIFSAVESVLHGNFSGAWETIQSVFSGWGEFFQGLFDDVVEIFADIGKTFFNIGTDIVNGLVEGVGDLWNGFLTLIGIKTDEVKEEIAGADGFDTHSPSKWARKVFRGIPEGGILGLDDGMPRLLSGTESAVRDIQNTLTLDPLHVSGGYSFAAPRLASATAGAAYGRGQMASPVPVNLTVVNEMEVGGVKVERNQRKYRISEDKRAGATLVKL